MQLSLKQCYSLAWKSFAKWWIPLCLISAFIFIFEFIPRLLLQKDVSAFLNATHAYAAALSTGQSAQVKQEAIATQASILIGKFMKIMPYIFPFIAFLTVILLMYANWAAKNKREARNPLFNLIYIAFVHVVLAVVKLITFFLLFFPGAYLYVKLLFVSLVMLESKKGAGEAIKLSWRMTNGNFWKLFLLVVINTMIQLLGLAMVIGIIPATGFVNTARAAAFRLLWEERK